MQKSVGKFKDMIEHTATKDFYLRNQGSNILTQSKIQGVSFQSEYKYC